MPGNFLNEIFYVPQQPRLSETILRRGTLADARYRIRRRAGNLLHHAVIFSHKHDDSALGKNRLAGYVLNLTPAWNPNWGGALQFYDSHDNCVDTLRTLATTRSMFSGCRSLMR